MKLPGGDNEKEAGQAADGARRQKGGGMEAVKPAHAATAGAVACVAQAVEETMMRAAGAKWGCTLKTCTPNPAEHTQNDDGVAAAPPEAAAPLGAANAGLALSLLTAKSVNNTTFQAGCISTKFRNKILLSAFFEILKML